MNHTAKNIEDLKLSMEKLKSELKLSKYEKILPRKSHYDGEYVDENIKRLMGFDLIKEVR